jgi:hypothetical protein
MIQTTRRDALKFLCTMPMAACLPRIGWAQDALNISQHRVPDQALFKPLGLFFGHRTRTALLLNALCPPPCKKNGTRSVCHKASAVLHYP